MRTYDPLARWHMAIAHGGARETATKVRRPILICARCHEPTLYLGKGPRRHCHRCSRALFIGQRQKRARTGYATAMTRLVRLLLRDRDGSLCFLCGGEMHFEFAHANDPEVATIEHVQPYRRAGRLEPANVRLVHKRCNSRWRAAV